MDITTELSMDNDGTGAARSLSESQTHGVFSVDMSGGQRLDNVPTVSMDKLACKVDVLLSFVQ